MNKLSIAYAASVVSSAVEAVVAKGRVAAIVSRKEDIISNELRTKVLFSRPETDEQAMEIVEMLVRSGAVDLVVTDFVPSEAVMGNAKRTGTTIVLFHS
jgi:RecA/RadA recombinase